MLLLFTAFAAEPEVTCVGEASWLATAGDETAMVGEGVLWKESARGAEGPTRASLEKQCAEALAQPDEDGWKKSEIEACKVVCVASTRTALSINASRMDPEVRKIIQGSKKRIEKAMGDCIVQETQRSGGKSPTSLKWQTRAVDGRLPEVVIPDHPELSECLSRPVTGLSLPKTDAPTILRFSLFEVESPPE